MAKFYMVMGNSDNVPNYGWRISEAFKVSLTFGVPSEDTYKRIAHLTDIGEDVVLVGKHLKSKERRLIMRSVIKEAKAPFEAVAVVCDYDKNDKAFEKPTKAEGFNEIWYYDGCNWEEK